MYSDKVHKSYCHLGVLWKTNSPAEQNRFFWWDMIQHFSRFALAIILASIILGLSFGLGACKLKPTEDTLPFETIGQKEWSGTGKPYELREPNLVIISRPEEVDHLNGWITEDARNKLLAVDYSDYFALLVLQGLKPSTDYKVSINRITRIESIVNIYVEFLEPEPNKSVGAMETSPYHLVKVQKTGSWGQEITFNLFAGETFITSLSHAIP